jgi:hypothetical protein
VVDKEELDAAMDHVMRHHGGVLRKLAPYDHTWQVTAHRDGSWWELDIEVPEWAGDCGEWVTQTPWLRLAEYMAKDLIAGMLDLDYEKRDQISVDVTRRDIVDFTRFSLRDWLLAQWYGVVDTYRRWLVEREVKKTR